MSQFELFGYAEAAAASVPDYATNPTDRTEEDHQADRRIVANRRIPTPSASQEPYHLNELY